MQRKSPIAIAPLNKSNILYTFRHWNGHHALDHIHRARRHHYQENDFERLAKSTGRSRSFLAAEAISEYLDTNEWQVSGIKQAMASLDRGEGVPHASVKDWVMSWGSATEKPAPKRS